MQLILTNISLVDVSIEDLGIYLQPTEIVDLIEGYSYQTLIQSLDLETEFNNGNITLNDGDHNFITYSEVLRYITAETKETTYSMNEPNGFINHTSSIIAFDDTTRTFSIRPNPILGYFHFYIRGDRVVKTGIDSISLPSDAEGSWLFYYDELAILHCTKSYSEIEDNVIIAAVYWDEENDKSYGFSEERHGISMDDITRSIIHKTNHTMYRDGFIMENYILNGSGITNAHVQFTLTNGSINDEDNIHVINHSDTPINNLDQILNHSTGLYSYIPVVYKTGIGNWKVEDSGTAPILLGPTGKPLANTYSTTTAEWILEEIPNNRYYAIFVGATPSFKDPIKAFMGQRYDLALDHSFIYNTLSSYDFGDYPFPEIKFLYKIIYHTKSTFNNSYKSIMVAVEDLRYVGSERAVIQTPQSVLDDLTLVKSGLNRQLANMMVNSLEIQALKVVNYNPELSYFVDSFNDDDLLENESTNYYINEYEGYIQLLQSGLFSVIDTTKANFDLGVFTETESFIMPGGDGEIQKKLLVSGGSYILEDFEDLSNVSTTGSSQQSRSSTPGTYYEGSYSLKLDINFSASSLSESSTTTIDLGINGVDISLHKFIKFYYFKQQYGSMDYTLELQDTNGVVFAFVIKPLAQSSIYQEISKNISEVEGVDLTAVRYMRIKIFEQAAGQTILNVSTGGSANESIYNTRNGYQSFKLSETRTCQRIRFRAKYVANKIPDEPLYISVANIFNTTLGITSIYPNQASTVYQDFYLTFDNSFNLVVDTTYRIMIQSATSNQKLWNVELLTGDNYTGGNWYRDNVSTGNDLNFTLYTPVISEPIYIDSLKSEAQSQYSQTGSFLSRAIPIGELPSSINALKWTIIAESDIVGVKIRFANSIGDLSTAQWSNIYYDPSGVNNNLSGITPGMYFQYEATWVGGPISSTSVLRDVRLEYTITTGNGSATIVSTAETTVFPPKAIVMTWEDDIAGGSINYFMSADGKNTWRSVLESEKGELISIIGNTGTQFHMKAILTGSAKLYGWSLACDQDFI